MPRRRKPSAGVIALPPEIIEAHQRQFPADFDAQGVQLLFAIRALARRINERANAWLAPFGLTARDMNYLASLDACGERDVTLNELGRLTHSSNAGVTQTTDSLERRGLVVRTPNRGDRRSTVVKLTPAGEDLFKDAFSVHNRNIRRITTAVDEDVKRSLLAAFVLLGKSLDEEN
jgi:DNA-binding MarR family transcriptional regulator